MSGECNICGGEHAELRCPASGGIYMEHGQLHAIADQIAALLTEHHEISRRLDKIAALCDEAGKPENRCATPDIFRQIAKIAKGE